MPCEMPQKFTQKLPGDLSELYLEDRQTSTIRLFSKTKTVNPSHTDPGPREKLNLNFYFHNFEAPQRSVKIKV